MATEYRRVAKTGTNGNDRLTGGAHEDSILTGLDGDDTLQGRLATMNCEAVPVTTLFRAPAAKSEAGRNSLRCSQMVSDQPNRGASECVPCWIQPAARSSATMSRISSSGK